MNVTNDSVPKLFPATFDPVSMEKNKRPIAVMMSGGVDSSVTALLLRDAGWDVVGITMKIPTEDCSISTRPCCGAEAALVCQELGIPHYFVDTEAAFRAHVIAPFKKAYCEGKTPSPCVDCNTVLKFDLVWTLIREQLGIDHLATGHYACVRGASETAPARLGRACDKTRDQSYFLYGIVRDRLPFLHLPLGDLAKSEVRERAADYGLNVAKKPDSMELCFAGEGDYRRLLTEVPSRSGPICNMSGIEVGQHNGIHNFTIGQRRGMGIAHSEPLYVIKIVPEENKIVVGTKEEGYQSTVQAAHLNILQPDLCNAGTVLKGKVRSVGEPHPCTISTMENGTIEVVFNSPILAPAAGQHLVLYDDEENLVVGGVITGENR